MRKATKLAAAATASIIAALALPSPAQAASYGFQCQIPRNGFGACTGDQANVPAGRYVRVRNVSSGGKAVTFRLYNTAGHHLLATSTRATPAGPAVFVWRNDTRRTIRVEFTADATGWVNVVCNAKASITTS